MPLPSAHRRRQDGESGVLGLTAPREQGPSGTRMHSYDALNRRVQVVTPQGTWQYEYDAFGNRMATVVNGQRTEYVFDPAGSVNITVAYDGAGDLLASYALGLGPEGASSDGGWSYYDFDAVGSTVGLSGGGSYTDTYAYDPFGGLLRQTGTTANPFQFVVALGVTTEGNGLDFMRARQYDVPLGRFTIFVSDNAGPFLPWLTNTTLTTATYAGQNRLMLRVGSMR